MDPMMLQTGVVGLIVAAAAVSIGRRGYRVVAAARRKSDAGCGGGCCGTK